MPTLVFYATILFTLAFLFYTIGIWAERLSKRLKPWHAITFFLGVLADTLATILMMEYKKGFLLNSHTVIGALGLFLMIFHFIWAVLVLRKADERALTNFHKFSVFVWGIWMIAYLSGVYFGMQKF
jgi:uncharacterized repeat protein (TIGR03987 family)